MKKSISILIAIMALFVFTATAQKHDGRTEDEKAIKKVLQNIIEAWAAGDGKQYADNFYDDVDYTVWNGIRMSGREENVNGHQAIFDTYYKGTRLEAEIVKIRFMSDDIAAVQTKSRIYRDGKTLENVPPTVPLLVFQKTNGTWKIAVLQNTPVVKQGELVIGRTGN